MSRISYFIAFILFHQVLTQVLGSKLWRAKNSTGWPDINAGTVTVLLEAPWSVRSALSHSSEDNRIVNFCSFDVIVRLKIKRTTTNVTCWRSSQVNPSDWFGIDESVDDQANRGLGGRLEMRRCNLARSLGKPTSAWESTPTRDGHFRRKRTYLFHVIRMDESKTREYPIYDSRWKLPKTHVEWPGYAP